MCWHTRLPAVAMRAHLSGWFTRRQTHAVARPSQIRYLVQHKKVSCLVTTAGGIEEDLMKCIAPHYMGSSATVEGFNLKGADLRKKGINRIGNLLVRRALVASRLPA